MGLSNVACTGTELRSAVTLNDHVGREGLGSDGCYFIW
jgi:hypothetical protein